MIGRAPGDERPARPRYETAEVEGGLNHAVRRRGGEAAAWRDREYRPRSHAVDCVVEAHDGKAAFLLAACIKWLPPMADASPSPVTTMTLSSGFAILMPVAKGREPVHASCGGCQSGDIRAPWMSNRYLKPPPSSPCPAVVRSWPSDRLGHDPVPATPGNWPGGSFAVRKYLSRMGHLHRPFGGYFQDLLGL